MSFVSLNFGIFVLVLLLAYYLAPKKHRWIVLLLASIYFYMLCGIKYIGYICVTTISTFIAARVIENNLNIQNAYIKEHKELSREEKKAYKATRKKSRKKILLLCVILNVGILAFLKYADFSIAYFNYYRLLLTGNTNYVNQLNLLLPLGISFYTFQTVGYLLDVYNGKSESEKNFFKFALFVSFFPQIIQGPISRFDDLKSELFKENEFDFYNIKSGFIRILWGLFKKLIIADRVAAYVRDAFYFYNDYKGLYILFAVFFYAMQIYGDFSGGIDITIGVAEMLSIKLTENFERPFFSKDIAEYWRRWHITLGTWFKDYIFYPLSVSKPLLNLGKKVRTNVNENLGKRVPLYIPLVITWLLTGMWHGSQSKYIAWGLLNCFFIILGTEFEPVSTALIEKYKINRNGFLFKFYRIFKTFWLMSFLRSFDMAKTAGDGFKIIKNCFLEWNKFSLNTMFEAFNFKAEDFYVAIIAIIIVFIVEIIQRKGSIRKRILEKNAFVQLFVTLALVCIVMIYGYYGRGFDAGSFIYLNF